MMLNIILRKLSSHQGEVSVMLWHFLGRFFVEVQSQYPFSDEPRQTNHY